MVFEEIALTKTELRLLKKSANKKISISDCPRLEKHRFVDEIHTHNPGHMPTPTGFATITDRGIDYLAYIKSADQNRKREHRHNWLIAIFSALAGAFLSKPLWDIIGWFRIALFGPK